MDKKPVGLPEIESYTLAETEGNFVVYCEGDVEHIAESAEDAELVMSLMYQRDVMLHCLIQLVEGQNALPANEHARWVLDHIGELMESEIPDRWVAS